MSTSTIFILMFLTLLVLMMIGVPVVYSVGAAAILFCYLFWSENAISGIVTASISVMNNWTLIGIPLFTFMSIYLFQTGMVEELYDIFYRFTGGIRGGLAICTILVGAMMGAMTGVIAGTVVALGMIALPQMLKYGYDKKLAMGAVLAGGTLGQLIPPSTNMVVYGSMTGISVGKLFACGLSSGIVLVLIYSAYILVRCNLLDQSLCPAMPKEDRRPFLENIRCLPGGLPPIILIVGVLGSIFGGIATPTEAAAVGSALAIVISVFKRSFSLKAIFETCKETLRMTAMIGAVTVAATFFGSVFTAIGGNKFVAEMAANMPGGAVAALLVLMGITILLGMFLDTTTICVICAPIFAPIVASAGLDPIWFAILFNVCLQMAYLSPPFGFSLFYLKGVTPPDVTLGNIYRSALPFLTLQFVGLALMILFPVLSTWGISVFMRS